MRPTVPLALAALACNGDKGDDTAVPPDAVSLVDAANYGLSTELSVEHFEIPETTDATVDWSALTEDMLGRPLDPAADIDLVSLVAFRYLSAEEVVAALQEDTLQQKDITLYVSFENDAEGTSCRLSELTLFGNDIGIVDYLEEGAGTWLLVFATGTTPGQGARALAFVDPVAGAAPADIAITDSSTVLTVDADLSSLERPAVAAGTADVSLDWSALTTDGRGNPIELGDIDELWLARYDGASVADLEAGIVDLEDMADALWTASVAGRTSASLSELAGDETFDGLTTDATWMLALRCSACFNPAPPFLTVLDVR